MSKSDYKILLIEDHEHMVAAVELLLSAQHDLRAARSAIAPTSAAPEQAKMSFAAAQHSACFWFSIVMPPSCER